MKKSKNTKKTNLKIYLLITLAITLILLIAAYATVKNFRTWVDDKIFKKNVFENNLATIEINSDDSPISFSYSNFIGVYSKNKLAS